MPEARVKLTGWQALIGGVVLIGLIGARFATFKDMKGDETLTKALEQLLIADYFPDDVERLKAAYASGDVAKSTAVAKSVTTTRVNLDSVQASSPLFEFSTSQDVVVKVTYSLNDASGTRRQTTNYYLFRRGSLGNTWQYQHDTTAVRYYLNFL